MASLYNNTKEHSVTFFHLKVEGVWTRSFTCKQDQYLNLLLQCKMCSYLSEIKIQEHPFTLKHAILGHPFPALI